MTLKAVYEEVDLDVPPDPAMEVLLVWWTAGEELGAAPVSSCASYQEKKSYKLREN